MGIRRSRLAAGQTGRLLEHFVAGTPARTAAELVGVNRNTARLFYHRTRALIAQRLAQSSPLAGEAALDESCLAGSRTGRRVHTPAGKVPVFGLLKRGGKIYAVMAPDIRHEPRLPTLKTRVQPHSIVYADTPDVHDVLAVSGFRYQRIDQRERFVRGRTTINSIDNFWNQAKQQMRRYNGIPRRHLHLFLKECEWRFNYGSPKQLLKTLKSWIKVPSG